MKKRKPIPLEDELINVEESFIDSLGKMGLVNLELAGIFFVNAYNQLKEGQKSFIKLEKEIVKYNKSYIINSKLKKDDFEAKQLQRIRNLEIFYEPVVRYFSAFKILLVCCAETYINQVAQVVLKGRKLEEFDKLSIIGKWLFIQDIIKVRNRLEVDVNPMQGFIKLVTERNKLVHFKSKTKSLSKFEVPNYIDDLALTSKQCDDNYKSIKTLIEKFSLSWNGAYGPHWLYIDESESYYRNPCFYLGNREVGLVLHSDKYDKERF